MSHIYEAIIFITYSFVAPVVTAGGSMLTTNALTLFTHANIIKATGITSSFFFVNTLISLYVFRKDVVWKDAKNLLLPSVVGAFIGSLFLVNIRPKMLIAFMFAFSLYFIYKKLEKKKHLTELSSWKEKGIAFFSSAVIGCALPGGGFLNAYFASKGYTLSQMFGTISFLMPVVFLIKLSVMVESRIISPSDMVGILYAFPFLLLSNIAMRKGMLKLSKQTTDRITIFAMGILSCYLLLQLLYV